MPNPADISQHLVRSRLAIALRHRVGQGRPWSRKLLAEAVGVSESAVRTYMDEDASPCLDVLLRLFAVLGPEFASHVLEPAGMSARVVPDGSEQCVFELNAALTETTALLGQAFKDGRITSDECEGIRNQLRQLRPVVDAYLGGAA